MKLPLSITIKLTLLFVFFAALLLAGGGTLIYYNGRATLEAATISDLLSTAMEKEAALSAWIEDRRTDIASLAASPRLLAEAAALFGPDRAAAHERLVAELRPLVVPDGAYLELSIIAPDTGEIIASTNPAEEGKFRENRPYFLNGKNGPYLQNMYYSISLQGPAMTAAAPLRSVDGRLLGVLAARLNLEQVNAIVQRRTGLRQSDDSFLVNTSNLFVTQPRLVSDPAVLLRGVHTEAVQRCLAGDSGTITAADYRGIPALIVYHWLLERQMCLIVKVDQAEAIAPVRAFANVTVFSSGLVLVMASVLAFALARTITGPVQQLMAGARELGSGNLNTRIDIKTGDELEQLAGAFARMAADLQKTLVSRDELLEEIAERKRAEDVLRESEERYRSLFENMLEGYAYCQMLFEDGQPQDFIYIAVNPTFEILTGLKDVVGKKVSQIIPGIQESNPELFEVYGRVALTGHPEKFETYVPALGIWFSLSVFSPAKEYFVAVFDNITERKQVEEEIRQLNVELEQRVLQRTAELNDLYNHAPCGYHSLDGDGVFVRINDTELNWLGYTREEIIGRCKFSDLLTPASLHTFAENFPVFKERGWVHDLEFDLVRKDGSILPVLLSATAVTDQDGRYLMSRSTIVDYTERKHAEAALRESQAKLETINKELEAFSYSVSHDLRAPLRGIDGWSLALLEDYDDRLDEQARQYLGRVRSEAQRMGRLIDDLLQLSRVTRAEMKKNQVDLTLLAQTVVARLQMIQPERRVEVVIQPGLTVYGDGVLLEVVLSNLLGNAWKFTEPRPQASIEFGCLLPSSDESGDRRAGDEGLVYFVRDNGVGFDMTYAQKLFGAFQRMHKASEFPGTGIGLATVQRIIHRHGGQVWAEAQIDRGATFYFTLEERV